MKTLQILISLWGILVTAQAQQSDRPAAMPTPPRTVGRLLFNGMSDDPKTVPVEKIDFQINTVDLGH